MESMFSKRNSQRAGKFIAPGKLARTYANNPSKSIGDLGASKSTRKFQRIRDEEQESGYNYGNRIGGGSVHTLIVHYGESEWKERGFTEDSSFLDILNLCRKFIDIYSAGFKVTDGEFRPLRNDKDLLAIMREHEGYDNIDIYVEEDNTVAPLLFKMPEDQPSFSKTSLVGDPKVVNVSISGENQRNGKIIVHGDVVNGLEGASIIQLFITKSKFFDIETDLIAVSESTTNKEFKIPLEAVGHFPVAKFTPMSEDGKSGEPKYAITGQRIEDLTSKVKKKRGKNKNKKVASLKSNEKLQIEFLNNRAVGVNHKYWSRHLGRIIRDKNICPIRVKKWKDLTESNKQHMWCSVKECYTNPDIELYREHTLEHMHNLWTSWRSSLYKEKVAPCKTKTEILANVPEGISPSDWEWLVTNKFLAEEFQKASERNANNRKNGVMPHRTGSKPHRQVIYEKGGNLNVAEIFYETRQKDGKFAQKKEKDKYDELAEIVKENPSLSPLKVVEKCFGQQHKGNIFCFGGGLKRKYLSTSQSAYVKELEAKILEKEEENRNL